MQRRRYTSSFEDVGSGRLDLFGGKGANLGELVRNGFPVPCGFCVLADAYRRFIECTGLDERISTLLEGIVAGHMADVETRASRIRALITGAVVPEEIASDIRAAYRELNTKLGANLRVAVRSSATAEDLPGASFAGQQDTFLNVGGEDALLEYVRRCWASLWTARAILYREARGFAHREVRLAVVVQEMFPSDVSGVLFTVNPVTSDAGEIIINASWGLGEAIVGGLVTPDQYVIDKKTLDIRERIITGKSRMIVPDAEGNGTREMAVAEEKQSLPSLPDAILSELAEIGRRIEAHYGHPQDIEWGYARGALAILQSRDVTGVDVDFGEGLEGWNRRNPELDEHVVWTRAWGDMLQPGAQTPLMYSIHNATVTRAFDEMYRPYGLRELRRLRIFRWHKTRLYYSTEYEKVRVQFWPRFARTEEVLRFFPPSEREEIRQLPFRWGRKIWGYVRLYCLAPRYSFHRCLATFYEELPAQQEKFRGLMETDLERASFEELQRAFRSVEELFFWYCLTVSHALMEHAYALILVLTAMLRRWCGDHSGMIFGALASGLQRNKTVQENIDVWKLSREVRGSATLKALFEKYGGGEIAMALPSSADGRAFAATLDRFLEEYGHRGGSERDLAHPRWRHRPELLLSAIKPLVSAEDALDPELTEAKLAQRREAVRQECLAKVRAQPWGFIKLPLFRFVLRWAEKYFLFRDEQRFYADYFNTARHDFSIALGRRLVEKGLMDCQADVFFLTLQEITETWEGRLSPREVRIRIRARRRLHEKYGVQAPAAFLKGHQGFDSDIEEAVEENVLRGVAASGGRITARARVCKSLEEAGKVGKGEILVACTTDPGWTSLFAILSGVVLETGGILAHATLVSREYGIPCVMNVNRATERIRDGQLITIDGDGGRVILERNEAIPAALGTAG